MTSYFSTEREKKNIHTMKYSLLNIHNYQDKEINFIESEKVQWSLTAVTYHHNNLNVSLTESIKKKCVDTHVDPSNQS